MKDTLQRWTRFLLGGGLNTAITYGLYLLLNVRMEYQAAYAIAYVGGILFSYVFNALVVFHVPLSLKGLLAFPVVYLAQYGISALTLNSLVEFDIASESVAPLIAVAFTIPITYILAKKVVQRPVGAKIPGARRKD